jgi:hypothetical protein
VRPKFALHSIFFHAMESIDGATLEDAIESLGC